MSETRESEPVKSVSGTEDSEFGPFVAGSEGNGIEDLDPLRSENPTDTEKVARASGGKRDLVDEILKFQDDPLGFQDGRASVGDPVSLLAPVAPVTDGTNVHEKERNSQMAPEVLEVDNQTTPTATTFTHPTLASFDTLLHTSSPPVTAGMPHSQPQLGDPQFDPLGSEFIKGNKDSRRPGAGRRELVDEILRYQDDPLGFLKGGDVKNAISKGEDAGRGGVAAGSPQPPSAPGPHVPPSSQATHPPKPATAPEPESHSQPKSRYKPTPTHNADENLIEHRIGLIDHDYFSGREPAEAVPIISTSFTPGVKLQTPLIPLPTTTPTQQHEREPSTSSLTNFRTTSSSPIYERQTSTTSPVQIPTSPVQTAPPVLTPPSEVFIDFGSNDGSARRPGMMKKRPSSSSSSSPYATLSSIPGWMSSFLRSSNAVDDQDDQGSRHGEGELDNNPRPVLADTHFTKSPDQVEEGGDGSSSTHISPSVSSSSLHSSHEWSSRHSRQHSESGHFSQPHTSILSPSYSPQMTTATATVHPPGRMGRPLPRARPSLESIQMLHEQHERERERERMLHQAQTDLPDFTITHATPFAPPPPPPASSFIASGNAFGSGSMGGIGGGLSGSGLSSSALPTIGGGGTLHQSNPFGTHTFVPIPGAPGFKPDEYDWDKGFSEELERERDVLERGNGSGTEMDKRSEEREGGTREGDVSYGGEYVRRGRTGLDEAEKRAPDTGYTGLPSRYLATSSTYPVPSSSGHLANNGVGQGYHPFQNLSRFSFFGSGRGKQKEKQQARSGPTPGAPSSSSLFSGFGQGSQTLSTPPLSGSRSGSLSRSPVRTMSEVIEKKVGNIVLKARKETTVPVLSQHLADSIRAHLPPLSRLPKTWTLLYSLDQHGISLNTLYTNCEAPERNKKIGQGYVGINGMLLIVRDAAGAALVLPDTGTRLDGAEGSLACAYPESEDQSADINRDRQSDEVAADGEDRVVQEPAFGAFIPEGLGRKGKGFFGGGESFLWKYERGELKVFKSTGKNTYFAICESDYMAFGGGTSSYGLYLDSSLFEGSSAPCPTFGNEVLCTRESGSDSALGREAEFECVGLEVWGIGPS